VQAIDEIKKFNNVFTPLSAVDTNLSKFARSVGLFRQTLSNDRDPALEFSENERQIDIYNKLTGIHNQMLFLYCYTDLLGNAFMPVLNQLTRDLNEDPPKLGFRGITKQELMTQLGEYARARQSRAVRWDGNAWVPA
jgi:hypothetical protein